MFRVILATLAVLAGLGALSFFWFVVGAKSTDLAIKREGGAGVRGAVHLKEAKTLLVELVQPDVFDSNATFLSTEHQAAIKGWLEKYEKIQKGSK